MHTLSVDLTSACNLNCLHCLRDKLLPRSSIPLELLQSILTQAKDLGIGYVSLTGGEPALYPQLTELLHWLAEQQLEFSIVSNGHKFGEKILPTLQDPSVRKFLDCMCFSLDGATADSHDALREEGSFAAVVQAVSLCRLQGIPVSLKSVVTRLNQNEITEMAFLASSLGVSQHSFLALTPTPRTMDADIVPSLAELKQVRTLITETLAPSMKTQVELESSWGSEEGLFTCNAFQQDYHIDHLGNLVFCCNLSHICNGNKPAEQGEEFLANLTEEDLANGILRHFHALAHFIEARLGDAPDSVLHSFPCWWCTKLFKKWDWLQEYSNHPWVKEVFPTV